MENFISSFLEWVHEGKEGVPLTDAPDIYLTHTAYWTLSTVIKRNFI